MNLCGGIGNVAEPEQLMLEIPNEQFGMSSRKKSNWKQTTSSRGQGSSRMQPHVDTGRTPSRSRTQSSRSSSRNPSMGYRQHTSKSTSALIKKLEGGFHVKLLLADNSKKSVKLDVDNELRYMRIRSREKVSGGNENDGSKSNYADIRVKLNEVARLEVGSSKHASSSTQSKAFNVITKNSSGKTNYSFAADSLAERDLVVATIKAVLETLRALRKGKYGQDPEIERSIQRLRVEDDRFEGRNDSSDSSYESVDERDAAPDGKNWTVDNIFCGLYSGSENQKRHFENGRHGGRQFSNDNEKALKEMKESVAHESVGWGMMGCQSKALAAVEDPEMAAMANQMNSSPWCTDDLCTGGFRDFADSMQGAFETDKMCRGGYTPRNQKQYMAGVLGAPSRMASMLSVKDPWSSKASNGKEQKRIQNRAKDVNAQAVRLKKLRNEMTFDAAPHNEKMPFVQVNNSFNDIDREGGQDEDIDPLCYDSDPGDTRERTLKRGPRRSIAERYNNSDRRRMPRRSALSNIPITRFGFNRRSRRMEDELVAHIIEIMKNERMTLMWHPTQTKQQKNRPPVCVKVWIESGTYLNDGTFLLPKLTWIPVHEGKLTRKILNASQQSPETLDLLDVCRVRECHAIDRRLHPFANIKRSFIMQTQSGIHLFETQSKHERGQIVNGLKLVIARLASLLMLRDLRAVDEFFGGNQVPGEAPAWLTGKDEDSKNNAPVGFPA